jgi:Kae1-associated kinase Bud32
MKQKIAQGAEAILYKDKGKVIKDRISKAYRIPQIDIKLRKERTKTEARILHKLRRANVNVPNVLKVDEKKAAAVSEYKSKKYYFCAIGCKKAFDQNPEQYLAKEKK